MLGQSKTKSSPWEGRVELGQTIVKVDVPAFPVVELTFADGYKTRLNLQYLLDKGRVFLPLRDESFFRTAHAGSSGGSLEWLMQDGCEIDLCADSLRMQAEGIWDPVKQEWKV